MSQKRNIQAPQIWLALFVVVLLAGFALRVHGLGAMTAMVHYDEAYYAVDALSLLVEPRLTPFFPENFGRESLWMYLLAPSLAAFGAGAFALRIVAIFVGTLTLAAVYRLAREVLGRRAALPTMAGLAVLFWHVLASHGAFRALLFPLVGALAFALLWNAYRTDRTRVWVAAGVLLGLLAYTYLAARLWLALVAVMLLVWLVRGRRKALIPIGIALAMSLPLVIYLLTNAAAGGQRVEQVAVSDVGMLISNMGVWLRVPFHESTSDPMYNLPGRPLFDVALGVLFVAGLVGLVTLVKRWRALWLVGLAAVSVAPAVLTTEPLKWLRAIGLVVPAALLLGVGAVAIERWLAAVVRWLKLNSNSNSMEREFREGLGWVSRAIPVGLLTFAAATTLNDFDRWLASPDLYMPMEEHIYAGIDWLAENTPTDAPVYFAPFTAAHPVLRLREWRLESRPVGAFESSQCLPLAAAPKAYYFALTMYDLGFVNRLEQWAQVETAYTEPEGGRYAIYRAEPNADLFDEDDLNFGGVIGARVAVPPPERVPAGMFVDVTFALRALQPTARAYTLFVHLYDGTELDEDAILLAQTDQPICPSDPVARWRPDEVVLQTYSLQIRPEIRAGQYTLAFGIYDAETLARLPVGDGDYTVIERLTVE